jgi:hypothetical protein
MVEVRGLLDRHWSLLDCWELSLAWYHLGTVEWSWQDCPWEESVYFYPRTDLVQETQECGGCGCWCWNEWCWLQSGALRKILVLVDLEVGDCCGRSFRSFRREDLKRREDICAFRGVVLLLSCC